MSSTSILATWRVNRQRERDDLIVLTGTLAAALRDSILAVWDEYDAASSPEAKAVKALDKLETIMQHSQGKNPPDFDYAFNLGYGKQYTSTDELFRTIRAIIDDDTKGRMRA